MTCTPPPVAEIVIEVHVAATDPFEVTFAAASSMPTAIQNDVKSDGELDLSAFCAMVPLHFEIVTTLPNITFHQGDGVRKGLSYSAHLHGVRRPAQNSGQISKLKISSSKTELTFTYANNHMIGTASFPRSGYILYLAQNGQYFGEVDPIIDNGSNDGRPPF
jgi:hypothetical protein